jgi:hypothetical protein
VVASRLSRHLEAVVELARASLALRLASPQRTAGLLGRLDGAGTGAVEPVRREQLLEAGIVGSVVARDARRLPWHPTCLRQALAVQRMLRRRGIPARLHLGVASIAEVEAHAWVTVGDRVVIGARERERFTPLGAFV